MSKSKENIAKHYLANRKRVKLYALEKQGAWRDLATGFVFIKKEPPFYLTMIHEISKSVVFQLSLMTRAKFHLRNDTIISWNDTLEAYEDNYALSFQDAQGVKEIWRMISLLKSDDAIEVKEVNENVLPEATLVNLPFIARDIQPGSEKLQRIIAEIKQHNCLFIFQIGKLLDEEERRLNEEKLSDCSSKSSQASKETNLSSDTISVSEEKKASPLSLIFSIIKNIILVADLDLLEKLMNEHICPIVFGALEYDIESPKAIKHRQYLSEVANFNNILLIKDDFILRKIQMNYLLIYLRDNVLPRFLDRTGVVTINRLIQMNHIDIIQFLIANKAYLDLVVKHLVSNNIGIQHKAILFISEVVNCCKDLFLHLGYFQELLVQCRVLKAIEWLLIKKAFQMTNLIEESMTLQDSMHSKVIEVLAALIASMPQVVKDYLLSKENCDQEGRSLLLIALTTLMQTEKDFGIKTEIGGMIVRLAEVVVSQEETVIQHPIFIHCLNHLGDFLMSEGNGNKKEMSQSKQAIVEILTSLTNYAGCMPYWFIDNGVIDKVLWALKDKSKPLTLSIVKFIKKMIELSNEHYFRAVVLSGGVDSIIDLFNENKEKENLLYSSLMSLFEDVIRDSFLYHSKPLISDKFKETINAAGNQKHFKALLRKYEVMQSSGGLESFSLPNANYQHAVNTGTRTSSNHIDIEFDYEIALKEDSNTKEKNGNSFNPFLSSSSCAFIESNASYRLEVPLSTPAFLGKKHPHSL